MLIRATRTVSALSARALFYAGLFALVAIIHVAVTTALRAAGWNAGLSLFASGAAVLTVVLVLVNLGDFIGERRAVAREMQRIKEGLPGGPCCVVWRANAEEEAAEPQAESDMPWELAGPLHARYPKLARRLRIEGIAIVDFEVGSDGMAKSVHCVDAWPSDVFYEAAREALSHAKFQPKFDTHVRYGASYRMPFVFRIDGASKLRDRGRHARTLRPTLMAATKVVENLRKSA